MAPRGGARRGKKKRAVKKREAVKHDGKITIDRRTTKERRGSSERRPHGATATVERRVKVNRRRQIDPTTCERDYTIEEIEFMRAIEQYKRQSGRMFPTCSEVLEVLKSLGYRKQPVHETPALPVVDIPVVAEMSPTMV